MIQQFHFWVFIQRKQNTNLTRYMQTCAEMSNHYVVYQELTQCCMSIIIQNQTNKNTSVVTRGEGWGEVELDEGS